MNETAVVSSAYLAPIQYYTKLDSYSHVLLEQHENFIKQTFRNRCVISSAAGPLPLYIPTDKGDALKCLTRDILIADEDWQSLHWKSIKTAYNSSPFFEYYEEDLLPFYTKKWKYLFDFNTQIQEKVMELIGLDKNKISLTSDFIPTYESGISDFREAIRPKNPKPDEEFIPQFYYQVFEEKFKFIPNLSIIDLLFNMGNESIVVLRNSFRK